MCLLYVLRVCVAVPNATHTRLLTLIHFEKTQKRGEFVPLLPLPFVSFLLVFLLVFLVVGGQGERRRRLVCRRRKEANP